MSNPNARITNYPQRRGSLKDTLLPKPYRTNERNAQLGGKRRKSRRKKRKSKRRKSRRKKRKSKRRKFHKSKKTKHRRRRRRK